MGAQRSNFVQNFQNGEFSASSFTFFLFL